MTTTVKVRTHTAHIVEFEDKEYEVSLQPDSCVDVQVKRLADGSLVIGYLVQDTDCQHPLNDCDGSGKIYRRYRDAPREEKAQFYTEMAVDEYGEKTGKPNPYAVLLDVYIHSGEVWRVHGSGKYFPDERWDVSNTAGVWVPDESCVQHIELTAAQQVLGDRGKILFGVPGRFGSYGWEVGTRRKIGLKSPFNALRSAVESGCHVVFLISYGTEFRAAARQEAIRCATSAVEEYNKWLSGDCWGVCIDTFDEDGEPNDNDSCWGYIGQEYAEEELTLEMEHRGKPTP